MYWTETTCLGITESKCLHADFPVPFLHSLTQKVHISLASAPVTHKLAEGGHKKKKDGSGADMIRQKEG